MEKHVTVTPNERVNNYVPEDLVFSILSKLPVKSLKKFGCVCKSWSFLFENPDFMRLYRNNFISNCHSCYDDTCLLILNSQQQSMLYLLSGERFKKIVKLDLPPPLQEENDYYIYMLDSGSVNGILCLCQGFKRVMLWNPTNGEFKVIPPSPVEFPHESAMVLFHGFGYDHVQNDYKLIRNIEIVALTANDLEVEDKLMVHYETLWEIYSLQSNSWRKLDVDMFGYYASSVTSQVYLDGICHWWDESEILHHDKACLVSFDMSNEVFFTTPMSSNMDNNFNFVQRQLAVLNKSIALISNYAKISTFQVSILGEVGVEESWIKLFIVGPLSYVDHPIGVAKKSIFFIKEDEELAWFDLNTQEIEELGIKGRRFCSQIVSYQKSPLQLEK